MQWYHYVLIALKVIFVAEFILVLVNKDWVDPKIYITSEILFKLLLSIYIQYVIIFVVYKNVSAEDKLFISFGAGLLMYDAVFNDRPVLLELYGIDSLKIRSS